MTLRIASSFSNTPNGMGGAPGTNGTGITSNPFTLTGTTITELSTDMLALSARTHRRASEQYNTIEMWYFRDSAWSLFPSKFQPVVDATLNGSHGIKFNRQWGQPATLDFTIIDTDGDLDRTNKESTYNYNGSGAFDPLLDEARQILMRVGTRLWGNLASGIVPTTVMNGGITSNALSNLTDGTLCCYAAILANTYVAFAPSGSNSFDIKIDLGASYDLHNAVLRTGTKNATCTLPESVQLGVSNNGVDYVFYPEKPVGGPGIGTTQPGDWEESYAGIAVEVPFVDLQWNARYVLFRVKPQAGATVYVDEIAVYGGTSATIGGRNYFVGYLGDKIDTAPNMLGRIELTALDGTKKLSDNNRVRLTAPYLMDSNGAVELADIAYNLLTNTSDWVGPSPYASPLAAGEIGWTNGSGYTGFKLPLWQGQNNSIFGYVNELFSMIGWHVYTDYNNVLQGRDVAFNQRSPDRVFVANTDDGAGDVRQCVRHFTAKNMRNAVEIGSGNARDSGSGFTRKIEPNSIARYGERTSGIQDPILLTPQLRDRVGDYFIRDYAWNLQTLECEIAPDFDTDLRQVWAFRAPVRGGHIFARSSGVLGYRRDREYWTVNKLSEYISVGDWKADAELWPYFPQGALSPNFNSISPGVGSGGVATITLNYDIVTDPSVVTINLYKSIVSENTGFTLFGTAPLGSTSTTVPGQSTAVTEWWYMTTVDVYGTESPPSTIISVLPGNSAVGPPAYTVGDFTVSFLLASGPDTQGYYTYQFSATWTSPLGGFTQYRPHAILNAIPANPLLETSWPIHESSWNWWAPDRIPSGKEWDRVTAGQLNASYKFRVLGSLSGHTIYWRFWNSTATRSWHPVESNVSSCSIP